MPLSVLTTITTYHLSDVAKSQLAQVTQSSALFKNAKCPLDSGHWVEDPTWYLTATLSLPDGPAVYGDKSKASYAISEQFLIFFKDSFIFILSIWLLCLLACVSLDTRRRQQTLELELHMIATAHVGAESNLSPQKEQPGTEPSHQPPWASFLLRDPQNAELWQTLIQQYVTHQSIYPQPIFPH